MARWKYLGEAGQLVDGEFVINLEPGQEFDAPDSFVPFPNPHPIYQPAGDESPAITPPVITPSEE